MISFKVSGSTKNTERFCGKMSRLDIWRLVDPLAREGVRALASATPTDSGLAANSWDYHITQSAKALTITWTNTDVESGFPVAISLQYGYATGGGGFVQGRDYINPALKETFQSIAERVWKVVTSA